MNYFIFVTFIDSKNFTGFKKIIYSSSSKNHYIYSILLASLWHPQEKDESDFQLSNKLSD